MLNSVQSLFDLLAGAYNAERHMDLVEATYAQERWFDTPRQRKAAELVVDALKRGGIPNAELVEYPADGKTRFQDWISHVAWDCNDAMLGIQDTGELLGSRAESPTTVVIFCGPLASEKHPAMGGVIDLDKIESPTPEQVADKFVLTAGPPHPAKRKLMKAGCKPLAIVSDWIGTLPGIDENAVKWCNTWSDSPTGEGWYLHAHDTVMTGFVISPRAGKLLRKRLAANPDLRLSGWCDARIYSGAGQCPTGVLPGQDPSREIWLYAHDSEQGATDNCSGVTMMAEVLIMLEKLIQAGQLPRPRHSIRMFSAPECLGTMAFATVRDDLRKKALAGLYADGPVMQALADWKIALKFGPLSNPGFNWALAGLLAAEMQRQAGGTYLVKQSHAVPTADDMIAEPLSNVPSSLFGSGQIILGYHTNQDTPATILPDGLKRSTIVAAAWAYIMADLQRLAGDFVAPAADWLTRNLARAGDDDAARLRRHAAGQCLRDLRRFGVPEGIYKSAADVFSAEGEPPLPSLPATGPVYRRKAFGNYTLEGVPEAHRPEDFSRWGGWYSCVSYWTDGQRSVDAIERLARAEFGPGERAPLQPYFDACVEAGIMERVR